MTTNEQINEQAPKEQQEAFDKRMFENLLSQFANDLDRYLAYMLMVFTLEVLFQRDHSKIEGILTSWTESFRSAVKELIEKENPEGDNKLATTALNTVVTATKNKLFKLIAFPPKDHAEVKTSTENKE